MKSNLEILNEKLELAIGFYKDPDGDGSGNFYLLGALPALIRWDDEEEDSPVLLRGRVVLTGVKGGRIRDVLGKKGNIDAIARHVDNSLIFKLLKGFDEQIVKIEEKRKLYGRKLTHITL